MSSINPDKIICVCLDLKYKDLLAAVKDGARTKEDIIHLTGAVTACKICENIVEKYTGIAVTEAGIN